MAAVTYSQDLWREESERKGKRGWRYVKVGNSRTGGITNKKEYKQVHKYTIINILGWEKSNFGFSH